LQSAAVVHSSPIWWLQPAKAELAAISATVITWIADGNRDIAGAGCTLKMRAEQSGPWPTAVGRGGG